MSTHLYIKAKFSSNSFSFESYIRILDIGGCQCGTRRRIGLVRSLSSPSILSLPGTGLSIVEYCTEWLLRRRNYWKLIPAVKAIIWRLRMRINYNWQTGETRVSSPATDYKITSVKAKCFSCRWNATWWSLYTQSVHRVNWKGFL